MTQTVAPAHGRRETLSVVVVAIALIAVMVVVGGPGRTTQDQQRLFDWQMSAFHDLQSADQAIYNALLTASEELWWIHDEMLIFADPDSTEAAWPTVEDLGDYYAMAPFTKDVASVQQGNVRWQRAAAYTFEGVTVYFGDQGTLPDQSAYLLVLTHAHKGASYSNGGRIWFHPDANVAMPATLKQDSLIVNGWREILPYSGAMEVERLKGTD